MNSAVSDMLVTIVRDLEKTRYKYNGYSYRRTIRNILIGNKDAAIAPNFKGKEYYGIIPYLTLEDTENMMDRLLSEGKLEYIITDHGKLYCTPEYYAEAI